MYGGDDYEYDEDNIIDSEDITHNTFSRLI